MTVPNAPPEAGPTHPLLRKAELPTITNWREWREAWDATTRAEFLHSLLHFGFDVPSVSYQEYADRICFYLALADGHSQNGGWLLPEETILEWGTYTDRRILFGGVRFESLGALRREIARKAFHVLCDRFFRDSRREGDDYPSWADAVVTYPGVFEAALRFLRLELDEVTGRHRIPNLQHLYGEKAKHHFETARAFAFDLVRFACQFYGFGEYASDEDKRVMERFRAATPELVDILFDLGRIDELLTRDMGGIASNLATLRRLEKLAMSQKIWDANQHRRPKNLEELICEGSRAALVLHALQVRAAARKRSEELKKLEAEEQEIRNRERELVKTRKKIEGD